MKFAITTAISAIAVAYLALPISSLVITRAQKAGLRICLRGLPDKDCFHDQWADMSCHPVTDTSGRKYGTIKPDKGTSCATYGGKNCEVSTYMSMLDEDTKVETVEDNAQSVKCVVISGPPKSPLIHARDEREVAQ